MKEAKKQWELEESYWNSVDIGLNNLATLSL